MSSRNQEAGGGTGVRKIRDSCTSCSNQKLRCSKERPACERCVTRGIECNYVVSMRTGRPPRTSTSNGSNSSNGGGPRSGSGSGSGSNSNSGAGSSRNTSPRQPQRTSNPAQDEATSTVQQTGWAMPSPTSSSTFPHDSDMAGDDSLWSEQASISLSNELESLFGTDNSGFLGFNPFLPIPDQPMMSDINTSVPLPPSGMAPSSAPPQASMGPATTTVPHRQSRTHPPLVSRPSQQTPIPKPVALPNKQQHPVGTDKSCHGRRQNCMATLFELTLDMYVSDQTCNTSTSSRDSVTDVHLRNQQQARDVDAVLFRNREAIHTLTKTLDCPCSTDQSISFAAYLLASKIVAWYGAILGVESDTPLEGEASTIASWIKAKPISIGNYRLDAKAQRSVRANVVLGELRTLVQPMIDNMPLFRSSNVNDMGRPGAVAKEDCMLRQQMQWIVEAATQSSEQYPDEELW